MFDNKFDQVLEKDEKIKWSSNCNKIAGIFKEFWLLFIIAPPTFFVSLVAMVIIVGEEKLTVSNVGTLFIILFATILLLIFLKRFLSACNTYFCITDKRVIKRYGVFNNSFSYYPIKNIGTVSLRASILDSKKSATLNIKIKSFQSGVDNNASEYLDVPSLNGAYEASKILNEIIADNDSINIKLKK